MQAKPWKWDERREPPLWQKARTLAVDYTESIILLAKIPGEWLPGANKALDHISAFAALYAADLDISPLGDPNEFTAVDGVPPPVTGKSGEGPVFLDGVTMLMTVRHNGKGREPITLEKIDLLVTPLPGVDPYFSYSRDIIGAGFIEPMRFFVELEAKGPRPARRQIRAADGKNTMLVARGPNFLNTDPESYYTFSPNEEQKIKFTLTALDAGYYESYLRFFYRVAARELRQQIRGPIHLYTDGA
jgi:hypothetical protein